MAERDDDRRHARPIVPDPDASLSSHRLRQAPRPRLWPLWWLLLGLMAAGGGAGYLAWEERQRLHHELARLSGELSNVHARFDTALGEGEALERIEARLDDLERRDEAHDGLLVVLEEDLEAGLADQHTRLDALQQRLVRVAEAAATREAMLAATQVSLDALERAGAEGRATLADALEAREADLATLSEARERDLERLATLDERLSELEGAAVEREALARFSETLEALETRFDAALDELAAEEMAQAERLGRLTEEVEALAEAGDDDQRMEAMAARLAALESELGELRRSQLALSARLEALRP